MMLSSSGLEKSASICEHCNTGPATCRSGQKCQAAVLTGDGTTLQYVFAQSTSTATLVSAEKDCFLDVRALAIGGGGRGGDYRRDYGGGGSGYPQCGLLQLRPNEALNLIVGQGKEASSVEKDGQVLLLAAGGQDGDLSDGGSGYSGGGAGTGIGSHGGDGGSDGSDGEDYSSSSEGGKGSGLDLRTMNMTRFVLTPGKAGMGGNGYSGGGGGILVSGEKPSSKSDHYGEGFGGGGWGPDYDNKGLPGCVLIEV